MNIQNECFCKNSGAPIPLSEINSKKNGICKIVVTSGFNTWTGSGFFTKFVYPFSENPLCGIMTNNHVLGDEQLKPGLSFTLIPDATNQQLEIVLEPNIFIFTSKTIDITFVQLNPNILKTINPYFFSPSPIEANVNDIIIIFQHPLGSEISISQGNIESYKGCDFYHNSSTEKGSSGSPVLNRNYEVVGVHKQTNEILNIATRIGVLTKEIEEKKIKEGTIIEEGKCGENVSYSIYDNGGMIIEGEKEIYDCSYGKSKIKTLLIKEGITDFDDMCFSDCEKLSSVNIPYSLTNFGELTFMNCSSLSSVVIPNSIDCIGKECFRGCSNLRTIYVPSSITKIGDGCFIRCSNLTNIKIDEGNRIYCKEGNIIKKKGKEELVYCNGCCQMKEFDIPTNISSIGNRCFYGCENLSRINIPTNVSSIGEYCFSECSNLRTINLPSTISSIEECCFSDCSNLSTLNIPLSVKSIGEKCFRSCSNLSALNIPTNVSYIGNRCFDSCSNLSTISILSNVSDFGERCFYGCKKLIRITVPASVLSIRRSCFELCSNLSTITIPTSVSSLGDYCFYECSNLSEINISNGVKSIGNGCFSFCTNLSTLTIPSSVSSIGYHCFSECYNLRAINIPSSVSEIGYCCFRYCSNLSSIIIPTSVSSIGNYCFCGCSKLKGNIRIDINNRIFRTDGTRIYGKNNNNKEVDVW